MGLVTRYKAKYKKCLVTRALRTRANKDPAPREACRRSGRAKNKTQESPSKTRVGGAESPIQISLVGPHPVGEFPNWSLLLSPLPSI